MYAKGLIIHPNGEYLLRDFESLDDVQEAVGSDNLDWSSPAQLMFYCYGFALYEQAVNPVATELYWRAHPEAKHAGHLLAGTVVAFGPPRDSEETDVPERYVKLFKAIRRNLGQDEINRRAVPLSQEAVAGLKAQQDQLWAGVQEKLAAGGMVDVGGILIGRLEDEEVTDDRPS
jgi:hypothetical protein